MKNWFAWAPLAPPARNRGSLPGAARRADFIALVFLGLGLLQVGFALSEGNFRFFGLALGMLLFGLPHGAIDHLVALGLAAKPLRPAPLAIVVVLYLLVVCAVFGFWALAPTAAVLGFLLMTVWHWGKSDLAFEHCVLGSSDISRGRFGDFIHLLLRGLIPIGMPFIAFPDQAGEFVNACTRIFAPESEFTAAVWRNRVITILGILFIADLVLHFRHRQHPLSRRILIENTLLAAFFYFVPPLVAIGWYFAGWHGFRHILRLASYLPQDPQNPDPAPEAGLRLIARQAVPFTLVSILMLVGLLAGFADRLSGALEGIALYLVLISALTLPHLIIVEWMDRREFV